MVINVSVLLNVLVNVPYELCDQSSNYMISTLKIREIKRPRRNNITLNM